MNRKEKVPECPLSGGSLVSGDDEGASLDGLGSVPQASLARVLLDVLASLNISICLELGQEGKSVLGLGEGLYGVSGNNQGDFGDGRDLVSASQDEGGHSGGCQSRGNSVPLLVDVHLAVPPPPSTGGGEHSSTTAHVCTIKEK